MNSSVFYAVVRNDLHCTACHVIYDKLVGMLEKKLM